jgi:phosphoglycerol transferase MdoB-like AlkP superfamily enzyme
MIKTIIRSTSYAIRSLSAPARVLVFLMLVLTLSRLSIMGWYWDRVVPAEGSWFILIQGIRFDLVLMGMLLGPALLAAPWTTGRKWPALFWRCYLVAAAFFVVWIEFGTISYIDQYDARPNYLYVEYLKYPREVLSMLLKSYTLLIPFAALGSLGAGYLVWRMTRGLLDAPAGNRIPGALLLMPVLVVLTFGVIRSTNDHHPVNPSTVAFSNDAMVNQLALNSPYTLIYAIYEQNRDSKSTHYGQMEEDEALRIVLETADLTDKVDINSSSPTRHQHVATRRLVAPLNLVIVLEESLGAEFVGGLGGKDLTPNLDDLANKGIWFEQLYATGTRSVRGVEAIISGFPPTSKRSTVKLAETQQNFFTVANLLGAQNYTTSLLYGGAAHFDNMRRFFLNNGFHKVIEERDFENPEFKNSWGVSDEDLFLKAHEYFSAMGDQPFFSMVFTTSNHKPFDIPQGKVEKRQGPDGPRDTAVAYADYALGEFLKLAKNSNYYENTVFLIVSDHNSRVFGDQLIPVERFHIPGVIIGGSVEARRVSGISSQIDLMPTLLSLMGVDGELPAIGLDLTRPEYFNGAGRAQMQFHDTQAWYEPGRVVTLQPNLPMQSFLYQAGGRLEPDLLPDEALMQRALAHALWAPMVIRDKAYHP